MAAPFKFKPEELTEKYDKYIEWLKTQYYNKADIIRSGERAGEQINIKIDKPPTVQGFCLYAGIKTQTLYNAIKGNSDNISDELLDTYTRIYESIQDYQVGGAVAGLLNPMLVARINGITETVNVNQTSLQPVIINVLGSPVNLTALYDNNYTQSEIIE